jgi:hypothetical protein
LRRAAASTLTYKLLEKDQDTRKHEVRQLYLELQATYKVEDFSVEGDFSERLMVLSQRITDEYRTKDGTGTGQKLTTEQVTELLYRHDLAKLRPDFRVSRTQGDGLDSIRQPRQRLEHAGRR